MVSTYSWSGKVLMIHSIRKASTSVEMSITCSQERSHGHEARKGTGVRLITAACSPWNWILLLQNASLQTGGDLRTSLLFQSLNLY